MAKTTNNESLDWDFFESIVVYNAIMDETYLTSIIDVVEPNYFKNDDIKSVFNVVTNFYKNRNAIPTVTEIKAHLSNDDQKQAFKKVALSFKQLDTKYNKEELYYNTERFFKERAVYNAVLQTANDYSQEDSVIDTSETLELFEKACGISLVDNLGRDYFNDIDRHIDDLQKVYTYHSTGYSWLDERLGGGLLATGRALYIICGTTNVGKSIMLGNIATNLVAQDKTVIVITLEMPETIYSKRISSQLSRIPLGELKNETDHLKDFVTKYKQQHPDSRLFIKEYAPKDITVNSIKAYIKKLIMKRGIKPDAIVVDYVNLIQPTVVTGNTYLDVKLVAEQLRAISYNFECPVVSATQLNRSAYDEINPGMETTSESMGLSHTADVQVAIWSSEEDKELGILHLGLQKNRFEHNYGKIALKIDYDTLAVDEMEDEYVDNSQVRSAEDVLDKIT